MPTSFEDLILRDTTANRPAAGKPGRLFFDSTLGKMQRDNGSNWDDVEGTNITTMLTTFALSGDISPAQITSNQNNYDPTGLSAASVLRLTTDASRDITGLAGGADGRTVAIHNVGSNDIVLKDESGSSSEANRFALTADLTISPDAAVVLQYDATSSRWRAVGGSSGGSGAPTNAEYVATAANGSLSAEVVIPSLAATPDKAGRGGAGTSEEWDSGTTGITWSPSDPATVDSDTTVESHIYMNNTSSPTTERLGTKSWSPAGALEAILGGVAIACQGNTNAAHILGLLISNSDDSNRSVCELTVNPSTRVGQARAFTYASSTYTQRGSSWDLDPTDKCYLRITRDGSNNWSFWFSKNGRLWQLIATQSLTFTVAKIGFRLLAGSGGGSYQAMADFLRTDV